MKRYVGIAFVLLLAVAGSSQAQQRYEFYTTYYDENGDQIGYHWSNCVSQGWGGSGSSNYVAEFGAPCFLEAPPFSCSGEGLTTIGSCESSQWCVSSGYALSFNSDMVANCGGVCKYGEGPGASGSLWCSTCWRGTGSCPTKATRPERKRPPVLTAAIDAKGWEIFAVLRQGK